MADFLDVKRREIDARLKELKPLIEEYERLEAAAAALSGVSPSSASASPPRRRQPAAATSKRKSVAAGTGGRRGRPKGSKRADDALALVTAQPGITIAEIAERMGIKQNYLYRVLPSLASEGHVKKDGRGWRPAEPA
jgi:sugar-specific transcriptional regulator TrmB